MGWIKDDGIKDEPKRQAAILAACILVHLALGVWLARERPLHSPKDIALEIRFIPAAERVQTTPPPPFPQAPLRPTHTTSRPRATPSAPPDRPVERPEMPSSQQAHTELLRPQPSTARLLDAASAAARAHVGSAMPAPRDPTQRRAPRLAGREEPYTPEAYVLREEISPEDVVNAIGSLLFGGQVDPCPDTRSKIRDLMARNDPRNEAELHMLIDRERRRCR